MSTRALIVMALLVAAMAAGAWLINTSEQSVAGDASELLLPKLVDNLNELTEVRVIEAGRQTLVTLRRGEDDWMVVEKDNYPADIGRIRRNLLALSKARIVEYKTARAEFYDRLGVEAIDADDATGRLLEIDGPGDTIALIIGETGVNGNMAYVRRPDNEQSYLVSADLDLGQDALDWIDRQIVDIASADIRAFTLRAPDGETIAVARNADDAGDFTVADLPEGKALKSAADLNSIAAVLSDLQLDDVRPADGNLPEETPQIIEFETNDGLVLESRSWSTDDGPVVAFSATAKEDAADGLARQINERVTGWLYTLPSYKSGQLSKTADDLFTDASE